MRKFYWFSLLAMFTTPLAKASLRLEVFKLENGQRRPLSVTQKIKPNWIVKEENVRVLAWVANLESSEFSNYQEVRSNSASTKVFLKSNQLILRFNNLNQKLTLTERSGQKLEIQVVARLDPNSAVIDENCSSQLIHLKSTQKLIPFYVGISCQKLGTQNTFSMSFPEEVDFANSTLFETKGKGEAYRYYQLGAPKTESGALGKFRLEYEGKPYDFSLDSEAPPKKDPPKEKPTASLIAIGAGGGMLSITGSDLTTSTFGPLLALTLPFYSLFSHFGVMAQVNFSVPLSSGNTAINYSQFEFYAAYEMALETLKIRPKLGYVIFSQSHVSSGIGLAANQLAFGLQTEYSLSKRYFITFDAMVCSFGSQVINSHYSFDLNFQQRKENLVGWGLGARLQSFTATSDAGTQRQFDQTLFYGLVSF